MSILLIISLVWNPDIHIGTSIFPKAYAVSQSSYTRGQNYNDTGFTNETHIWNGGLPPYVQASNGTYVPYRVVNNSNNLVINTGFGAYVFNKNSCLMSLHTPTLNPTNSSQLVGSFNLLLARSSSNVNSTFQNQPINVAVCSFIETDTGNKLVINATKNDVNGTVGITYTLNKDQKMKTTYFFNPNISGYYWRIAESQKNIPKTIILANATYLLNNSTNSKNITSTIITNSIKNSTRINMVNSTNTVTYDYQTSLSALTSTSIYLNATSNQAVLINTWQTSNPLNINQKFTIDPTYEYTAGTIYTPRHDFCGSGYDFNGGILYRTSTGYCSTMVYKWDISSIPSLGTTILSTNFQYNIIFTAFPQHCDYWSIEKDPASSSAKTVYLDSFNGTKYVSDDTGCDSVSNGKILNLGGSANTDIQNNLSRGWWALGQAFVLPDSPDGGSPRADPTNPQLQISYQVSTLIITTEYNNGTLIKTMNVTDTNSSKSQTKTVDNNAMVTFTGLTGNQNYTYKDTDDKFVVNKTLNFVPTVGTSNAKTYIFDVDCSITGIGNDLELKVNDTDGHHITSFTTPSCASNANVTWSVTWTANGNSATSYSSKMLAKILNTIAFGANAKSFKQNGNTIATSFASPKITSSSFTIGTGLQTITQSFGLLLDGTPAKPTNLSGSSPTASAIILNWVSPNTGGVAISGFQVETSLDNSTWSIYNSNVGNVNSYQLVNLQPNTVYYLRVSTITSLGTSSPSLAISILTLLGGTGSVSSSSSGAPSSNPTPTTPPPSPSQLNSQSVIIGNTLISIQPKTYQLTFGTTLPSEAFQFTWNSTKDISVTKIEQSTSPITVGNSLLFPYTMKGNSLPIGSTGIVPFSLAIPTQCTDNSTSTCANPTTYNIPVTFTIKIGDQTGTITSNISIDLSRNQSLTTFVVFFSVIAIVAGGIIYRFVLKRKKNSNQNRPNKEITKFIQKVETKSSSRHPFSEKKSKSNHNRPDNSWSKKLNKVEKDSRNRFG